MMNDNQLDERIAELVRSVRAEVPPGVEGRIKVAAAGMIPRAKRSWIRRPLWLALVPSAAAIWLAVVALLPPGQKAEAPIAEIRTEFEIADKDIKIIFFQKPDFNLIKEN